MIRETSLKTFNEIRNNGMLTESRLRIYRAIVYNPKVTSSEVFHFLGLKTNQSGRFTELHELGLIKIHETRLCKVTNRKVISWISTNELPKKKPKKQTKKERTAEAIEKIHSFMSSIYMNSEQVKEYDDIIKLIKKI